MRSLNVRGTALILVSAIALAALFVGCEDEPSTGNVDSYFADSDTTNQEREDGLIPLTISPDLASVSYVGERIALRAEGAILPITWSPANYDAATVTVVGPRSDYAVYQAKLLLENSVIAVDAAGRVAKMDITVGAISGLAISPSSPTLIETNVTSVTFTVSGGAPPYGDWEVAYSDLGVFTGDTYTATNFPGTNIVSISDSAGTVATASIAQQE